VCSTPHTLLDLCTLFDSSLTENALVQTFRVVATTGEGEHGTDVCFNCSSAMALAFLRAMAMTSDIVTAGGNTSRVSCHRSKKVFAAADIAQICDLLQVRFQVHVCTAYLRV
jgi:hypothetical protein